MIKVTNLIKNYSDIQAVKNVSFEVHKNEIVGFIGQNGAGKSTTIRSIMNLIFPTSGKILVCGKDVIKQNEEIKKITGYVPSEVEFYHNQTSKDVFNFVLSLANIKNREYLEYLCEYFELDVDKKICELSLGNKKKVSLIAALIKKPKLLILDEPTSGLDPLIQDKLFTHLKSLVKEDLTVFLSSHNLSEVEKYCDRVLIIKNGELVDTIDINNRPKRIITHVIYTDKFDVTTNEDYEGDINILLKKLSQIELKNLEIRPFTLEEEFMKYYNEVGDKNEK